MWFQTKEYLPGGSTVIIITALTKSLRKCVYIVTMRIIVIHFGIVEVKAMSANTVIP